VTGIGTEILLAQLLDRITYGFMLVTGDVFILPVSARFDKSNTTTKNQSLVLFMLTTPVTQAVFVHMAVTFVDVIMIRVWVRLCADQAFAVL
jgi:hypothetical protein